MTQLPSAEEAGEAEGWRLQGWWWMQLAGAAMREGLGAVVEDGCLQGTSSDLRDRQVPEVTCHSQDMGREKGQTHLLSRKALAVQACSCLAGEVHGQLGCRVPHKGFANTRC